MYKQVIVANKGLNMSAGKLAAMVAHGSVSFMCEWFKKNVATSNETYNDYVISPNARVDKELYAQWISGDFTKIILEVDNADELKKIIQKAQEYGMINRKDFFSIVDESTEFHDIPTWAVVAFRPMDAEKIDRITGNLPLYGYNIANNIMYIDTVSLIDKIGISVIINDIKNNSWRKINLSLTDALGEQVIALARCYNISTIYIDVLGYGMTTLDAILSNISIIRETDIHTTYYIPKRISKTEHSIKILPVIMKPLDKQLRDCLCKE